MEYRLNFHAGKLALPALDKLQTEICGTILAPENLYPLKPHHALLYGRPGSGRTTIAISIARELFNATGKEIIFLVPDRLRADRLQSTVEAALPTLVRPVRTPTALAYRYLNSWYVERVEPLMPPQLLTGAREDKELAELIEKTPLAWPAEIPQALRESSIFRMEIRNLFERAREMGVSGKELISLGRRYQVPIWESSGELLTHWEKLPFNTPTAAEPAYLSAARLQEEAAKIVKDWEETKEKAKVEALFTPPYAVIVDDLQDCTLATLRFLQALAAKGTRIIATANPDIAVATYRGGEPHLDGRLKEALQPQVFHLGPAYRGNQRNTQLVDLLAEKLTVSGGVERRKYGAIDPNEDYSRLKTAAFSSTHQENAAIIKTINHHYLRHETPLTDIAVIVRNSADVERIRQALVRAGLAVSVNSRAIAYAQEPLTAMLLRLLSSENTAEKTIETPTGEELQVDQELQLIEELVRSPLVQFDPLKLQRVTDLVGQLAQRELNLKELFALITELTSTNSPVTSTNSAVTSTNSALAATNSALTAINSPDKSIEFKRVKEALLDSDYEQIRNLVAKVNTLVALGRSLRDAEPTIAVWKLWEATELEEKLAKIALSNSPEATTADDRLDAVISLSRTADVWQQRNIGQSAQRFADEFLSQKLPSDNLAAIAQRPAGVEILTVMQAAGKQWPVVIVAGVQADKWPNLAIRNRLTRAGEVTYRVNHPELTALKPAELNWQLRIQSRIDELRTFICAISRTQKDLYVYAVSNEDEVPSVFYEMVTDFINEAKPEKTPLPPTSVADIPEADLRSLVAKLRRLSATLPLKTENDSEEHTQLTLVAERLLAFLAQQGIRVANPLNWTGIELEKIENQQIFPTGKPVLSPSAIESLLKCPAQWFLSRHGGTSKTKGAASLGNLVHAIAEKYPQGSAEELLTELENIWDDAEYNRGTELGRRAFEDTKEKIVKLAGYFDTLGSVKVEVEKPVKVDVGPAIIVGFIDRLEHLPDGVIISDIKTGLVPSARQMDKHKQLAFYQYALMKSGANVIGARLIALKEKQPNRYVQTRIMGETDAATELLENTEADLAEAVKRAKGPFYEPIAGPHCDYCEVKASCPLLDEGLRTIE
ncbi:PD-(D/E)XK nuclease family protein [Gleimia sp. 6138-11-ORH1]|uniref:PD-(D/E)XK nuclease family protein n=1 Tax=Gleimia sp. 6138-11-ORH1 TaxID=2973937 RepID=UPI002168EE4E|nr:PD-(D/E)XK nuclease family protein [Gleimia sp. 6138-11-ORH1]MCS4483979.1 PD-(D/E)XK nuclease family protein [Gleimia sp. 6138-11-ORH1]